MSGTILLALAGTGIAGLPLLVSRRKSFLNPALWFFAIVVWCLLLEALYIAAFRTAPAATGYDRLYVSATSPTFFFAGALLVFVAVCGYVIGFFAPGRYRTGLTFPPNTRQLPSPHRSHRVLFLLLLFTVACFLAYLVHSGVSLTSGPMTAKRFNPRAIGAATRFLYVPYYFFRLSFLSGSVAYAAVLVLLCGGGNVSNERKAKLLFSVFFVFAVALSHFASLRLAIVLLVLQVLLLVYYLGVKRYSLFVSALAIVAFTSFGWITLLERAIPAPPHPTLAESSAAEARAKNAEEGAGRRRAAEASTESELLADDDQRRAVARGSSERKGDATVERDRDATVMEPDRNVDEASSFRPPASDARPPPASPVVSAVVDQKIRQFLAPAFEGRYLMNIAKMAQLAHHFPEESPFLTGASFLGRPPATPDARPTDGTFNRYLSRAVFNDPNNNISAGFVGELYINFGYLGVLAGFALLGAFHRLVFNHLERSGVPALVAACLIVLIPATTFVLLDAGVVSAAGRSALDIGAILLVWLPWANSTGARDRSRAAA